MRDMRRLVAVLVGDGQMAVQCAKLVAADRRYRLALLVHHGSARQIGPGVPELADSQQIPGLAAANVNDGDVASELRQTGPDILFSVNNWDLFRADVINIPADGIINFHNGPLPGYRGVNVPSWAIINQEKRHGVTWHFVTERIDAGDIVASQSFDLDPSETAISLTLRCIRAGIDLFPALLGRYAERKLEPLPQRGEGRYYSARQPPPNGGYLDFNLPFDQLSALVRGLSFRPFENTFAFPRLRMGSDTLLVSEIGRLQPKGSGMPWTRGEIREIDGEGMSVCADDAVVRLTGLMQEDLQPADLPAVARRSGLAAGKVLART